MKNPEKNNCIGNQMNEESKKQPFKGDKYQFTPLEFSQMSDSERAKIQKPFEKRPPDNMISALNQITENLSLINFELKRLNQNLEEIIYCKEKK